MPVNWPYRLQLSKWGGTRPSKKGFSSRRWGHATRGRVHGGNPRYGQRPAAARQAHGSSARDEEGPAARSVARPAQGEAEEQCQLGQGRRAWPNQRWCLVPVPHGVSSSLGPHLTCGLSFLRCTSATPHVGGQALGGCKLAEAAPQTGATPHPTPSHWQATWPRRIM